MINYQMIFNFSDCFDKANEIIKSAKERIIIYTIFFDNNEYTLELMKNLLTSANKNVEVTIFINSKENVFLEQENLEDIKNYNLYVMHLMNHPLVNIEVSNNYSNYILVDDNKLLLGNFYFKENVKKSNTIYLDGNNLNKIIREEASFMTKTGDGKLTSKNNFKFMQEVIESTNSRLVVALDCIKSDKIIKSIKKVCKAGLKVNIILKKNSSKLKLLNHKFNILPKKKKINYHLNIIEKKESNFTNLIFSDDKLYYYFGDIEKNNFNCLSIYLTKIEENIKQDILNEMID